MAFQEGVVIWSVKRKEWGLQWLAWMGLHINVSSLDRDLRRLFRKSVLWMSHIINLARTLNELDPIGIFLQYTYNIMCMHLLKIPISRRLWFSMESVLESTALSRGKLYLFPVWVWHGWVCRMLVPQGSLSSQCLTKSCQTGDQYMTDLWVKTA